MSVWFSLDGEQRAKVLSRFWTACAVALLIPVTMAWVQQIRAHGLTRPSTPVDIAQPVYAGYWRFLQEARRSVPDGSSYTIRARNAEEETSIFLLSRGIFAGVEPYPATYWGAQTGGGSEAKYLLIYGAQECPENIVLARPVTGGIVCIRESR